MHLVEVSDSVFCIPGATNIGVISSGKEVVLIDTGIDKESGRKILKTLEKSGFEAKAIINTHSHADHFGGNSYIVKKAGVKVYAPEIEAGIILYPYLEPLYLFSAHPVKDLMSRFLMAKPSRVDFVLNAEKETEINPWADINVKIVPLPGHSPAQIGVEAGGILFCADSVFSKRIMEKYGIPLFMDIGSQKETLSFLERSECEMYIPCHAEPVKDITDLVELNLKLILQVEELIVSHGKATTEEILKSVCREFRIKLDNFTEYSLMLSAVKAYLSHLYNSGLISAEFDGMLYWKTKV